MNSEQIANIIYDAIDLAVSKLVADAGYDKTILALVLECLDATTGKYYVLYQDSKFTAYAENIEVVYPINSTVLILIPNNDWTQEKVIVGAKTKKSINYVSNVSPYINIEDNLVGEWLENFGIYGNLKTLVLYDSTTNLIDFDADSFNELAKLNQYISIAAMFRTEIPRSQRYNGTYGIRVTLNNTVLTFDIDDMIGTPYSFNSNTRLSKVYEINSETFTNIEKIELFIDFPSGDPVIVYLSHLELNVARKMDDAEIAGPWLYIIPNYKGTFTSSVNNITLNTEIYIKRLKIDNSTLPLAYYWFRENLDAVEGHVDYLNYGGKGWLCINSFTPIEYDENGVVSKKNWVTNQSTISLKKEDFNIKKTTIKCVVIYDEETKLNAETIIINNDAPNYDLKIKSTHGENFNFNVEGGNTLTCEIFTRENDTLTLVTDVSNYEFTWVKEDVNNSFTRVKSWIKGDNQYEVDFSSLRLNATFKCEVKLMINGVTTLLGTASIKLLNAAAEETLYQLIISNNSLLFKYDASGRSPASSFNTNPQPVLPLDFTLYDATGKPIDKTKISNIQWLYPTKDSFITEVTIGEEPEEGKERLAYPLSFKILSKFNGNYSPQEKITLSVVYNGETYLAEANMLFLKDGDSGTNGTDMFCRIVPVVLLTEKEYPMITSLDFSKNTLYNNYKVELYKNGSLIDSNSYTVDWNIWKSETDKVLYKFTEAGKITLGDIAGNAAGVLKATVNFNGKKYYAAYPLIYLQYLDETNTPNIKIKYGTGFSEVTYDANGNFPAYKGSNDFTVEVENIESPTITWTTSNSQLIIDKIENLSASISAIDSIDGLTLNNNIICNIDNIAIMYIPVHMALNKFGLANINEWDGTSVEINEDGEYILTPLVGAGEKDANNAFTGLVMGKVKTLTITDIGLFGYSHGTRSIFLDAKTGKAEFGLPNSKIIIDPTNGQARITGGGYSETNKTGMLIDLAEPAIKWGNGNFIVDKDGNVQLNGNIIWGAAASPTLVVYANSLIVQPENGSSWISFPEISLTDWHRVKQSDDYWGSYTYDGGKTWTASMQIVGLDGKQGQDGKDGSTVKTAYLYYLKSETSSTPPSTPIWNGSGNPPSGWTTSPSGVSSTHIWEFISLAIVTDGVYGAWSAPVVWARYGSDGANGTDATVTMTNVFNALTNNGVNLGVFTWENNNKTSILINADYIRSKIVEAELVLSKHVLAENIEATGGKIGGCEIKNGVLLISTANITDKLTADLIDTSSISFTSLQGGAELLQTVSNNSGAIKGISEGLTAYVKADTTGEQTSWKLTKDAFLVYSKSSSSASDVEVLRVDKDGLKVTGTINATRGTFDNCTINSNCTIKGVLSGNTLASNAGSSGKGSITYTDYLNGTFSLYTIELLDKTLTHSASVKLFATDRNSSVSLTAGTGNGLTISYDTMYLTHSKIINLLSPSFDIDCDNIQLYSPSIGIETSVYFAVGETNSTIGDHRTWGFIQDNQINLKSRYIYLGRSTTELTKGWLNGNWFADAAITVSSDAKKKFSISLMSNQYETLFNNLIPRLYKYINGTSDRIHTGFIALEVNTAIEKAGLTTLDLAAFVLVKNNETQETYLALRYEEFIALNTYMIQKQQKRIDELETTVELLQNKLNSLA